MMMLMNDEFTCLVPGGKSGMVMCKGKFRSDCNVVGRKELGKYHKTESVRLMALVFVECVRDVGVFNDEGEVERGWSQGHFLCGVFHAYRSNLNFRMVLDASDMRTWVGDLVQDGREGLCVSNVGQCPGSPWHDGLEIVKSGEKKQNEEL